MYIAYLTKKTKLFQPHYRIDEREIYITDTKRAKLKFLKSGIKDVYFGEEFKKDNVIGESIRAARAYDKDFVLNFLEGMIESVTEFFSYRLPYGEIAVFSPDKKIIDIASRFTKMVSVVGFEGEDEMRDGMQIRYIKKVRTPPDLVITDGEESLSPIFRVPRINIGERCEKNPLTLTRETVSFTTDIFPHDINMGTLLYLLKAGENINYKISSYRKKCPEVFTFC